MAKDEQPTLWPADEINPAWLEYAVDPAKTDEFRKSTYLSYEAFLRANLRDLDAHRESLWHRDYSGEKAYLKSVEPMRERFKQMLGFWEEPGKRSPVNIWDREEIADAEEFTAHRFRIEILPGLETYGISMQPRWPGPYPGLALQHGYAGTPEVVCGFTESSVKDLGFGYAASGIRAVRRGFYVVAINHPSSYGEPVEGAGMPLPGFPNFGPNYPKNRLHRLGVLGGGSLIGLDMMGTSRGIDLMCSLKQVDSSRIGMYGLSQGGLSTLYLPAMDQRIKAAVSSAYFNTRLLKMIGPGHRGRTFLEAMEEDKFFFNLIRYFGDADIASLIAPRAFAVEAGEKDPSIDFDKSWAEFQRAKVHWEKLGVPERVEFIGHDRGHVAITRRAFDFLEEHLGKGGGKK